VREGFVDAFVGVLKLDIFTDDADANVVCGVNDALDEVTPFGEIWLRGFELKLLADDVIETLFMEFQR
jgi:hypothetical protein